MEFFGIGLDRKDLGAHFLRQVLREERDEEFAGLDLPTLGEWVSGDHGAADRAVVRRITSAWKPYLFSMTSSIRFASGARLRSFGTENDVTALDVGLDVAQSEGQVEGAEVLHLDSVMRPEVDSAQEETILSCWTYPAVCSAPTSAMIQ